LPRPAEAQVAPRELAAPAPLTPAALPPSSVTAIAGPDLEDGHTDDPVDRLRTLISERREETLEVLRGWMDESPETRDAR
jgi:flagellar M-ring protein FliF